MVVKPEPEFVKLSLARIVAKMVVLSESDLAQIRSVPAQFSWSSVIS